MTHQVATHTHDADPPANNDWTEARVALLVDLRDQGVRRHEIADMINKQTGSTFTRSAVSGKIDRLFPEPKLVKPPHEISERIRLQRIKDAAQKREKRAAAKNQQPSPARPAKPELQVVMFDPADYPEARVYGVANLKSGHCRFECSGDDFDAANPVFCGLPILPNSKFEFCAGHNRLCTVVPLKRLEGKAA